VQGAVGVAVAAVVEAEAAAAAGGHGDGAGAAERGEGAVVVEALDVLAGGDEQLAGVAGGDGEQLRGAGRGSGDERGELLVEGGDLLVELGDAARERAQRELGGLGGLVEACEVGAQAVAQRGLAARRLAGHEVLAQLVGRGDDHLGELVKRGGAGLDRAGAGQAQLADGFDDAVGELGDHRRVAGQGVPGGHFGVNRIALAPPTARVRVRLVDLNDGDLARPEVAHQAGGEAAGRFDADDGDRPEGLQPGQQGPVALRRRRKRLTAQEPAALVERRGVVGVGVGVNAARDRPAQARHAAHAVPFLERAASAGAGGQNSDEARVASRFL
jgi:hypothetical protein